MKKMTIDGLAILVANGFNETKTDMSDLRKEIKELDNRLSVQIKGVDARLSVQIKGVDARLSTIEFLLSSNRIDRLEDSMRQVKTILKIK